MQSRRFARIESSGVIGAYSHGGRIGVLVDMKGGLISKGEPVGASHLGQVVEIVSQLRGESGARQVEGARSEEHTSELQSLMRISYAVFCLKKKKTKHTKQQKNYKNQSRNTKLTRYTHLTNTQTYTHKTTKS